MYQIPPSAHGTFIGSTRIEARIPTQLPIDSSFHFGASTRMFTLRKRVIKTGETSADDCVESVLPQDQSQLDTLTQFNTLSNKRITLLGITDLDDTLPLGVDRNHSLGVDRNHSLGVDRNHSLGVDRNHSLDIDSGRSQNVKRKRQSVRFKEEEDIINPEDVDPSVGKFRNLVQTEIVSTKRRKSDLSVSSDLNVSSGLNVSRETLNIVRPDHDPSTPSGSTFNPLISNSLSIKLGIHLPNPAPIVDHDETAMSVASQGSSDVYVHAGMTDTAHALSSDANHPQSSDANHPQSSDSEESERRKKKMYAKEAWPGRKPPGLF